MPRAGSATRKGLPGQYSQPVRLARIVDSDFTDNRYLAEWVTPSYKLLKSDNDAYEQTTPINAPVGGWLALDHSQFTLTNLGEDAVRSHLLETGAIVRVDQVISEGIVKYYCNVPIHTKDRYVKITGHTADPANDFPFKYDWEVLVAATSFSPEEPETGGWDGSSRTGSGYAINLLEERIGAPQGDEDFADAYVPNDTPVRITWNPAAQRWEFDSVAGVERC